jgi:hypothetical protein
LPLASLLLRLRRATLIETGLFEIQADHLPNYRKHRTLLPHSSGVIHAVLARSEDVAAKHDALNTAETPFSRGARTVEFARCFLGLPIWPISRSIALSRYEATLSRQVGCILFALEALDRRKPQERRRTSWPAGEGD